jgi:hypothetical protein
MNPVQKRSAARAFVLSRNLNRDVLMMQPAKGWQRCDAAELLPPPKIRSILVE